MNPLSYVKMYFGMQFNNCIIETIYDSLKMSFCKDDKGNCDLNYNFRRFDQNPIRKCIFGKAFFQIDDKSTNCKSFHFISFSLFLSLSYIFPQRLDAAFDICAGESKSR